MQVTRAVLFDLDDAPLDADAACRVGVAWLAGRAPGLTGRFRAVSAPGHP